MYSMIVLWSLSVCVRQRYKEATIFYDDNNINNNDAPLENEI